MVVAIDADGETRKILALLPYGVVVVERDWRVSFTNSEANRILGHEGATLWERCPELEATAFATAFRYAMADRAELISESALPTVGWIHARARPTESGLLITLRQLYPEAAETKKAKQALLAGEIGFALTRREGLREMLQRCADAVVRNLDAAHARVWTLDAAQHELVLQAVSGVPRSDTLDRVPLGRSKIGAIAARGVPHLTNDFQHDPRMGNREWAVQEGIVSFAGYPLRVEGNVVGVLAVYGKAPFGADLSGALASVADSIALGIERKQADEARRLAEADLRTKAEQLELINEIGKNLTSELELGPLVQRMTNLTTRLAHATFGAFFYTLKDPPDGVFEEVAVSGIERALVQLPVRVEELTPAMFPKLPVASFLAEPVTIRGGKVIGTFVFGHDQAGVFTEHVERLIAGVAAQAAIAMDNARLFRGARELINDLEKINAELDQFAYVASHDLKAPLRGIANLSQWIEDDLGDKMDDQGRIHMGLLRGRVSRLESLIDGILHYSRAGRTGGSAAQVDVGSLVREIWELLAPPSTARLVVGELPSLHTLKIPLQQVLMNLIGNAVKYNRDRDLTVEVGARFEADEWIFHVRDNGTGIAPEFHARIWQLFQTLEARDKVESTGIGLAVVRKVVESRGGRAWLESTSGNGATFYFSWPQQPRTRHG